MRNRGPGKYREWRWGQTVIPLYCVGDDPNGPVPAEQKPLTEVTHLTLRALESKGALPKLKATIDELVQAPDSPGGRFSEIRFRDALKEVANGTLAKEEVEEIFPIPPETVVRRGSKSKRRTSSKSIATQESGGDGSKNGSKSKPGTIEG